MPTQTDIMNLALSEIGAKPIQAGTENSEQALRATFLFPAVVRSEFRKHAWSCAMHRASLAASVDVPAFQFSTYYNVPTDFLRLWQINDQYVHPVLRYYTNRDESPFTIEGRRILTNLTAPLKIRYIRDLQANIDTWDTCLQEVVALRLALKLIPSTVKSDTKYKMIFDQYKDVMRVARRINAIELPPVPIPDDSWIFGRL